MIRRLLALIPRPLVEAVPVSVRDAVRTGLLTTEKRLRRPRRTSPPPALARRSSGEGPAARPAASPDAVARAVEQALSERFDALESQLRGVGRRLEDVLVGIDQLDARLGATTNGPAPSPVDDIRAVIEPLQDIRTQLSALAASTDDRSAAADDA